VKGSKERDLQRRLLEHIVVKRLETRPRAAQEGYVESSSTRPAQGAAPSAWCPLPCMGRCAWSHSRAGSTHPQTIMSPSAEMTRGVARGGVPRICSHPWRGSLQRPPACKDVSTCHHPRNTATGPGSLQSLPIRVREQIPAAPFPPVDGRAAETRASQVRIVHFSTSCDFSQCPQHGKPTNKKQAADGSPAFAP